MNFKLPGVNAVIAGKTLNVSHDGFRKIITDARLLFVLEIPRLLNVFGGLGENGHASHAARLARRFFSWATVRNFALPDSIFSSR